MPRHDGRLDDALRPVEITPGFIASPAGSALITAGRTRVICTASVESRVPQFIYGSGQGWVTAEYGMLPGSTDSRVAREAARGKQSGRTMEIQRLIGRALRSVIDMRALGERTIWVDCDVIEADGGTRTAGITGGFVAMCLALAKLRAERVVKAPVLRGQIAAVSVGVVEGRPVLDLDYVEDSAAQVDMNVVRTGDGRYVEVQGTAEGEPYPRAQLDALLGLADTGIERLIALQREALGAALDELTIAT